MKATSLLLASSLLFTAAAVHARLGETEEQARVRYGEPVAEAADRGGPRRALMEGAKEVSYQYEGFRIRAAYVNKLTVRIEYSREGAMTEKQVDAILDAEKGPSRWKEVKEERGGRERRVGPQRAPERVEQWVRGDKSVAKLQDHNAKLVIEVPAVGEREKKSSTVVPKF